MVVILKAHFLTLPCHCDGYMKDAEIDKKHNLTHLFIFDSFLFLFPSDVPAS